MSQNIVLETKQNKKGVHEVVFNQESSIIQKAKETWGKLKEFIVEAVNKVKVKIEDIKSNFEDIKSNPIYQGIKYGAKSFFKNTAIGTAVVTAWGVVVPGLWTATIAAALTITACKYIKTYVKASTENINYKFSALNFVFDAFNAWCYAIIGAGLLTWIVPAVLGFAVYAWVYGTIFLFA